MVDLKNMNVGELQQWCHSIEEKSTRALHIWRYARRAGLGLVSHADLELAAGQLHNLQGSVRIVLKGHDRMMSL
jgi:hypothetical protein